MHAIAYDEIHDEIYVTQQFGQGILVFRGAASGEEPPVRVINGSKTGLIAPDRLAVDPVHASRAVPGQVTASSAASARVKDTRLTAALPSREVVCRAV